jgi:hypothetical protein
VEVFALGIFVSEAIGVLGANGYVHRDVRPMNVIQGTRSEYVLIDAGISLAETERPSAPLVPSWARRSAFGGGGTYAGWYARGAAVAGWWCWTTRQGFLATFDAQGVGESRLTGQDATDRLGRGSEWPPAADFRQPDVIMWLDGFRARSVTGGKISA